MQSQHMSRRRVVSIAGAGVAAVAGLARYGVAQDSTTGVGTPVGSPGASPVASPAASPVTVVGGAAVSVAMLDFKFEPVEVSIAPDTDVSIDLTNGGVAQHIYWIVETNQGSELVNPGESASISVNLPTGEYTVHCTVPGHVELGMVGKLIVG